MGQYDKALAKDLQAYELCRKIFVKSSASEPQETLTALMDIADDYRGLRDYSTAIKYYEAFLAQYSVNNAYAPEVAEVRKNLAYLYNVTGEYEKTVQLYDFLKKERHYSFLGFDGLLAAYTADVLGDALVAFGENVDLYHLADDVYSEAIDKFEDVRYFGD